jgi:hypothetical protein
MRQNPAPGPLAGLRVTKDEMLNEEPPPPPTLPMPMLAAADLQDNLLVAANDLERLERLLVDASETLMGHFHGASIVLNELLRAAARHPELDDAQLNQAVRHLGGAVTALQFQDMSSQLITHLLRRLHRCAERLARDAMDDEEDGIAIDDTPERPNPVTQDEMDAGSIELF